MENGYFSPIVSWIIGLFVVFVSIGCGATEANTGSVAEGPASDTAEESNPPYISVYEPRSATFALRSRTVPLWVHVDRPGVEVTVNGDDVPLSHREDPADFATTVELDSGEHTLEIVATDAVTGAVTTQLVSLPMELAHQYFGEATTVGSAQHLHAEAVVSALADWFPIPEEESRDWQIEATLAGPTPFPTLETSLPIRVVAGHPPTMGVGFQYVWELELTPLDGDDFNVAVTSYFSSQYTGRDLMTVELNESEVTVETSSAEEIPVWLGREPLMLRVLEGHRVQCHRLSPEADWTLVGETSAPESGAVAYAQEDCLNWVIIVDLGRSRVRLRAILNLEP